MTDGENGHLSESRTPACSPWPHAFAITPDVKQAQPRSSA
jgi:hypothetical protein